MRATTLTVALVAAFATLSACKIVKNDAGSAPKTEQATETDHIAQLVADSYDAKLLPLIAEKALPVADLRAAIASDLEAAGKAHGNRGAGEGAAWAFAVKGSGKVISANLQSRARVAELDTNGDGTADLTLALGPVIKGTALRDVAPFYNFNDFHDQIEFAKLARALNDKVSATLVLPEGDITGKTLTFEGVAPFKTAKDPMVVTATKVTVQP